MLTGWVTGSMAPLTSFFDALHFLHHSLVVQLPAHIVHTNFFFYFGLHAIEGATQTAKP